MTHSNKADELTLLLDKLAEVKERENHLKTTRSVLEYKITDLTNIEIGKSRTFEHNKYRFTVKCPVIRKLDQTKIDDIYNRLDDSVCDNIFNIKYSISEAKYKLLEHTNADAYEILNQYIETKPGKPSVTLKEIESGQC